MTALEELRTRLASPHNLTGANDRLFAAALLELAARLDALEARMDGPTPTIRHDYSLRPALGRPGDELPPQESVAKE